MCIYSYTFKHQLSSNCSTFDKIHLSRLFFQCSKQFFELVYFDAFQCFCHFCFTSSTLAKYIHLRTFFIQGTTKKVTLGKIRWIGRVGHGSHNIFLQKLPNTQHSVSRCARKSPIMKQANMMKESSKKKITEAKGSLLQHHQLVHW